MLNMAVLATKFCWSVPMTHHSTDNEADVLASARITYIYTIHSGYDSCDVGQVGGGSDTEAMKKQAMPGAGPPEDATAYLARAIRAQCPVDEVDEDEQRQIQQERIGLLKRLSILDVKLEDAIRKRA